MTTTIQIAYNNYKRGDVMIGVYKDLKNRHNTVMIIITILLIIMVTMFQALSLLFLMIYTVICIGVFTSMNHQADNRWTLLNHQAILEPSKAIAEINALSQSGISKYHRLYLLLYKGKLYEYNEEYEKAIQLFTMDLSNLKMNTLLYYEAMIEYVQLLLVEHEEDIITTQVLQELAQLRYAVKVKKKERAKADKLHHHYACLSEWKENKRNMDHILASYQDLADQADSGNRELYYLRIIRLLKERNGKPYTNEQRLSEALYAIKENAYDTNA